MRIILLRHGKPDVSKRRIVSGREFGAWINEYNSAKLDLSVYPPPELCSLIQNCNSTVCSSLPRSIESAEVLGIENYKSLDYFKEADLPHFNLFFLKLRAKTWLVVFRILWLLGFSAKVESFSSANSRSKLCAKELSQMASDNGSALFVGHGVLNMLISKKLIKSGWHRLNNSNHGYWAFSVYEKV